MEHQVLLETRRVVAKVVMLVQLVVQLVVMVVLVVILKQLQKMELEELEQMIEHIDTHQEMRDQQVLMGRLYILAVHLSQTVVT